MGSALFAGVAPFSRADFRDFLHSCGCNIHEHPVVERGKLIPFGGSAFLTRVHIRGRSDNQE